LTEAVGAITSVMMMRSATSRVTSQNQISIPAEVRRRFGIVPGTELVWEEEEGRLVVHPKRFTVDDLRAFCARRGLKAMGPAAVRRARDSAVRAKYGRG
jgi:AbrB family looped-hinge helix DNA binding protein